MAAARPRSLSASASTILRFFTFGRRSSAADPPKQQTQHQQQPDSSNDNPLLRPSTAALPPTSEETTAAAGAAAAPPGFAPVVSFVSVACEERADTQPPPEGDSKDVLAAVWQGRHAGQDALRASYLAMYQCESL